MNKIDLLLPGISCPMHADSGVCMSAAPMRCMDVKQEHCFSMRISFRYGFNMSVDRAEEKMKAIKEKVDEAFAQEVNMNE